MEICPKCHQTMTWYMTYNCGTPYCGYHCNNCGYDTMNNTHTVTTSKTISINNQPKPIIQMNVVNVSDDSINKIADAVVQKLKAEQTEPSEECKTCEHFKYRPNIGMECEYDTFEQTDCSWK